MRSRIHGFPVHPRIGRIDSAIRAPEGIIMAVQAPHTWFDTPDHDGVAVAVITDDLRVEVNALGTVTICGWGGSNLQLDLDDALDITEVLVEAIRILRASGHRTAYPLRLRESASRDARSDSDGATRSSSPAGDEDDSSDTGDG